MNKVLNLLEYDQVRFEEAQDENKEGLYDGRLLITRETLDQLEEVNKPQKFLEIYRNKIKALNYVGVVKAGSITIEILPKFISSKDKAFEGTDKNTESIIMGNLLKMLYFTGRLKFKEVDTAELRRVDDCDFFEVFVYLFAKNLVNLLKFKQDKKYLRKYEELRFVKGRIDTSRYCANPAKVHIIPCQHFNRSMNNTVNKTLKYSTFLMSRMVNNRENFRLLKQILNILDSVDLVSVNTQEIDAISFNRLNSDFKPFIDICKMFLSGSSLTLHASKIEFFSLMIPMEVLFEEFIGQIISSNPNIIPEELRSEVVLQMKNEPKSYLATRRGKREFRLKPDILVKGVSKAIIDTKYKMLDENDKKLGVSQQDLYQMYAYCRELQSKKALLIYPQCLNEEIDWVENSLWRLGREEDIELYVRTIPLSYDLTSEDGFSEFLGELRNVLSCLGDSNA